MGEGLKAAKTIERYEGPEKQCACCEGTFDPGEHIFVARAGTLIFCYPHHDDRNGSCFERWEKEHGEQLGGHTTMRFGR